MTSYFRTTDAFFFKTIVKEEHRENIAIHIREVLANTNPNGKRTAFFGYSLPLRLFFNEDDEYINITQIDSKSLRKAIKWCEDNPFSLNEEDFESDAEEDSKTVTDELKQEFSKDLNINAIPPNDQEKSKTELNLEFFKDLNDDALHNLLVASEELELNDLTIATKNVRKYRTKKGKASSTLQNLLDPLSAKSVLFLGAVCSLTVFYYRKTRF